MYTKSSCEDPEGDVRYGVVIKETRLESLVLLLGTQTQESLNKLSTPQNTQYYYHQEQSSFDERQCQSDVLVPGYVKQKKEALADVV